MSIAHTQTLTLMVIQDLKTCYKEILITFLLKSIRGIN